MNKTRLAELHHQFLRRNGCDPASPEDPLRAGLDASFERSLADWTRDAEASWRAFLPPLFKGNDLGFKALSGNRREIRTVVEWKPGSRGLFLSGPSGSGKTRSLIALAERLSVGELRPFTWLWQAELNRSINADSVPAEFMERMDRAAKAPLLFLDDFGKFATLGSRTGLLLGEIEALIDRRHRECLPLLLSTNLRAEDFQKTFGAISAEPVLRRLTEMCDVVQFK
jgi:DNA replication protein DnaC